MPKTTIETGELIEQLAREAMSRFEGEETVLPDFAAMDAEEVLQSYVYWSVRQAQALTNGPRSDSDLTVVTVVGLWKALQGAATLKVSA